MIHLKNMWMNGWGSMLKEDFPLLLKEPIVYLDSAASAQKPQTVLESIDSFYRSSYANIHRGQCSLAVRATEAYENARRTVADFIHANTNEIVFTKGTTESINLIASGYAQLLYPGDEVLVCIAEHHADFVPWQQACLRSGATFKVFDVLPSGKIDLADFQAKLSHKTKIVAMTHISNVLGMINPVRKISELAHQVGAKVLIDGAQSIAHIPVDIKDIDCDFLAFSGHKLYGPTGIGVLYGKKEALESLPPYQFGGDMIRRVTVEGTTFADVPARFEAGTTPFVETVGLAEAIRYVQRIGMEKIADHERFLTRNFLDQLQAVSGVLLVGESNEKHGIVSFNIKDIHPADIAFALAQEHICVRVGHHCAMPIHHRFGQELSLRVSFGLYNDESDISVFVNALKKAITLLRGN